MERYTRRWLRSGLVLGTALAGAAYCWHRVRTETPAPDEDVATDEPESMDGPEPITERHAGAFLVRRRLDPDWIESVRATIDRQRDECDECNGRDEDWLLAVDGATTASLFLDRNGDEPELVWYVEVPWAAVDVWDSADPAVTLERAFPVSHEAICDGDPVNRELLVHAVHPDRPGTTVPTDVTASGRADREDVPTVDVELVWMDLESGVPERLADWFAGLSRRVIDGKLQLGRIESWSVEMLETEQMFTESVFLERRGDGYSLVGYMETAAMAGVYDAYYDTWNPVARISEVILGRVLVDPDVILSYPLNTDIELLAHATDPARPRRASECSRSLDESTTE